MEDIFPIKFTIKLAPITKKNSQRIITYKDKATGKTRKMPIPSKQFTKYQEDCIPFLPKLDRPINDFINIKATYYLSQKRPTDLSNLNEALHDVLVHYKVIEDDNNLIIGASDGCRVLYDKDNPRTEVEISLLEEAKPWEKAMPKKNKSKTSKADRAAHIISFENFLINKGLNVEIYESLPKNQKIFLKNNYENLYKIERTKYV